jgi:hypothetical protein
MASLHCFSSQRSSSLQRLRRWRRCTGIPGRGETLRRAIASRWATARRTDTASTQRDSITLWGTGKKPARTCPQRSMGTTLNVQEHPISGPITGARNLPSAASGVNGTYQTLTARSLPARRLGRPSLRRPLRRYRAALRGTRHSVHRRHSTRVRGIRRANGRVPHILWYQPCRWTSIASFSAHKPALPPAATTRSASRARAVTPSHRVRRTVTGKAGGRNAIAVEASTTPA